MKTSNVLKLAIEMKKSTMLKLAKKHLAKHYLHGVCLAVDDMGRKQGLARDRVVDLEMQICERIKPFSFAHNWLAHTVLFGKPPKYAHDIPDHHYRLMDDWIQVNRVAIQEWRLRWMDRMIAEFRAKGD